MSQDPGTTIDPAVLARAEERFTAFEASLAPEERDALRYLSTIRPDPESLWPIEQAVAAEAAPVTIFALPTCSACKLAASFLTERGAHVTMKDVTLDRTAAQELIRVRRGVPGAVGTFPLILVGKDVVKGFDVLRLRQLLLNERAG